MEDVFDLTESDQYAEIKVANQDWSKKMRDIQLTGEREALGDVFDCRSSLIFDKGLNVGFEAVKDLALLKGHLLFFKSRNTQDGSIDKLISSLQSIEADVIRQFASDKWHFSLPEVPITPPDLLMKVNAIKDEVNNFLLSHKGK